MAATYKDIRRLTGLSLATISKYFNGGTVLSRNRELIQQAASQLGYQLNEVARGLRSRRSMTVGVLVDRLDGACGSALVARIERRLRDAGYATVVCTSHGDQAAQSEAVEFLAGRMVDGLIVVAVGDGSGLLALVGERPVVAVNSAVPGADSVVIDAGRAITDAVAQLADQGHHTIGLLAGPDAAPSMRQRREAFVEAVRDRTGLLPRIELISPEQLSVDGGSAGMRRLLRLSAPPTAVVCAADVLTVGATVAAGELERCDRPVIVGFDYADLTRLVRPRPMHIEQPAEALAAQAAELILARLSGEGADEPVAIRLEARLVPGHDSGSRPETGNLRSTTAAATRTAPAASSLPRR